MNVERTVIGFLFGALIGNVVGFTFRFFTRHPLMGLMIAFVIYGVYQAGPGERIEIARRAEQTMLGTPSEEALAEAEERGETIKPQPKVVLTKIRPVPYESAQPWERGYSFDDVEVEITNRGDVDVRDIGLSCRVRKVGDHPVDPPHFFKADHVQFTTVKAGETKTLVYPFRGLRVTKLQANSFECTPFWSIDNVSALKAAGKQDLDLTALTEVTVYTGTRAIRYMRQSETVVTVSGEVRNTTENRFVKGLRIQCETVVGDYIQERSKDTVFIDNFEVLPGQTRQFGPKDVAQFRTRNGLDPVSSTCRVENVFEENADDRKERIRREQAEKEMLAKMTPLERKKWRERRETLWGKVSNSWQ